jgi:hypothetical protein
VKLKIIALSFGFLFSGFSAHASFDENARRYLSAQELIQALAMFFPIQSDFSGENCKTVNIKNSASLGLSSPVTGNPIAPGPTQATVQWITTCVSGSMNGFRDIKTQAQLSNLIGPEAYAHLSRMNYLVGLGEMWSSWPLDLREKAVAHALNTVVGSDDVIRDFGLVDPDLLRAKLNAWPNQRPQLTVFEVLKFLSVNLALRDEFLSY